MSDVQRIEVINSLILDRPWQSFKCTPIHSDNFHKFVQLKPVLTQILEDQIGHEHNNEFEKLGGKSYLKVEVQGFKRTGQDFIMTFIVKAQSDREPDLYKVLFIAILSAIGELVALPSETLVWMPLMICKGKAQIRDIFFTYLQDFHGLTTSPLAITPEELKWMQILWIDSGMATAGLTYIYFVYHSNYGVPEKVTLKIELNVVRNYWNRIHDENSNEVTIDQVNQFFNAIVDHFEDANKADFHRFTLKEIINGAFDISCNGNATITNKEYAPIILSQLSDCCQAATI